MHILNKAHLRSNSDKNPYELWHGKLASIKHFKVFGSKCFIKNNAVKDMLFIKKPSNTICKFCQLGKKTHTSFKTKEKLSTSIPLQLVHMDLCGP